LLILKKLKNQEKKSLLQRKRKKQENYHHLIWILVIKVQINYQLHQVLLLILLFLVFLGFVISIGLLLIIIGLILSFIIVEISFSNNVAEVNELNYISQIQIRILHVLKLCLFFEMGDTLAEAEGVEFLHSLDEIKEKMIIHGRYVEEGLIELYKSAKDYTKGFPIIEEKNVKVVYMIMSSVLSYNTLSSSLSVKKIWLKDINVISILKNSMNFAHDVENNHFYSEFDKDPIPTSSYYFIQSMIPVLIYYYFFFVHLLYTFCIDL
jgi:hypothetical protein